MTSQKSPQLTVADRDPRVRATANALRYAAGLIFISDEKLGTELYAVASQIEAATDVADWWCCPVCEEVTCDDGCPLEPVRSDDA